MRRERQPREAVDGDQRRVVGEEHRLAGGEQPDISLEMDCGTVHLYSICVRISIRPILGARTMATDGKSETPGKDALHMRGARSFMQGRFETVARETFDDGWTQDEKDLIGTSGPLQTQVTI